MSKAAKKPEATRATRDEELYNGKGIVSEEGIKKASENAYFVDYFMEGRVWDPENDDWSEWGTSVADSRWVRSAWMEASKAAEAASGIIDYNYGTMMGGDGIPRQGRAAGCIKIWRQDLLAKEITKSDVDAARSKLERLERALAFNEAGDFSEEPAWTREDVEYGGRYADYSRTLTPELAEEMGGIFFAGDSETKRLRDISEGKDFRELLSRTSARRRYEEALEASKKGGS